MDVTIVYERKNRELENAVLLQLELQKRGLKCNISQFYDSSNFLNKNEAAPKVILVPHLYDTNSIPRVYSRFGKADILINLQYEQVLSEKWEEHGFHNPKNEATKAYHICWGPKTVKRLEDAGVPEDNLLQLGAMQLDLLRDEYRENEADMKKEYSLKYDLPLNKDWMVFISSFTYADIEDERLKMNENVANTNLEEFKVIHTEARDEMLKWFEKVMEKDNEFILIYRPHPDELNLEKVKELEKKYPNFHIIGESSVKKWISVADFIYSWYSTSIVEAHFLDKNYAVLRPTKLPETFDSVLIKKANIMNSYGMFEESIANRQINNKALSDNDVREYYDNFNDNPSFVRYADFIVETINNNQIQDFKINDTKAKSITYFVKKMNYLYRKISRTDGKIWRKHKNWLFNWFSEFENQFTTDDEIEQIRDNIQKKLINN